MLAPRLAPPPEESHPQTLRPRGNEPSTGPRPWGPTYWASPRKMESEGGQDEVIHPLCGADSVCPEFRGQRAEDEGRRGCGGQRPPVDWATSQGWAGRGDSGTPKPKDDLPPHPRCCLAANMCRIKSSGRHSVDMSLLLSGAQALTPLASCAFSLWRWNAFHLLERTPPVRASPSCRASWCCVRVCGLLKRPFPGSPPASCPER